TTVKCFATIPVCEVNPSVARAAGGFRVLKKSLSLFLAAIFTFATHECEIGYAIWQFIMYFLH
ncbi:MAG TPA: hypothetical protein VGE06_05695, partial [Flavisolibacter sp.]